MHDCQDKAERLNRGTVNSAKKEMLWLFVEEGDVATRPPLYALACERDATCHVLRLLACRASICMVLHDLVTITHSWMRAT